jgi:hypothetical protein
MIMTSQTEGPLQDPHRQEPLITRLKKARMSLQLNIQTFLEALSTVA